MAYNRGYYNGGGRSYRFDGGDMDFGSGFSGGGYSYNPRFYSGGGNYGGYRRSSGRGGNNFSGGGSAGGNGKKHSGFSTKRMEDGTIVCFGWNYSRRRGMIKIYATPYKGTKEVESKDGTVWLNYFVRVSILDSCQTVKTSGMYDVRGKRLIIKDLGMIGTLKGKGGYLGTYLNKG